MGMDSSALESDGELYQLRHDLRQYIAAGTLLTNTAAETAVRPEVLSNLEYLKEIFVRLDELTRPPAPAGRRAWFVDVVDVVRDCMKLVQVTHDVPLELHGEAAGAVRCDPVLLRRAVTNVLDNATRAAGSSGTVRVSVNASAGHVVVEVSDDGDGFGRIPPGSGRGMSVVDRAIRSCQGHLEINSGDGVGTTVRMHIPGDTTHAEMS